MEGTVKFFNRKKGFGFINGEDSKDYFVHFTGLAQGTFLRDNDKVSCEPVEGDKGLKAEKVTLLQKASEMGGASEAPRGKKPSKHQEDDEQEAEE